MRITISCCVLLVALPILAPSVRAFDAAARAKLIASCVEDKTALVAHINLTRFLQATQNRDKIWPEITAGLNVIRDIRQAGGEEAFVIFRFAKEGEVGGPKPQLTALVFPVTAGNEKALIAALPKQLAGRDLFAAKDGDRVICGFPDILREISTLEPRQRPDLESAFAAAGDTDGQILLLNTPEMRQVIDENMMNVPAQLGGGPNGTLSKNVSWIAAGVQFDPNAALNITVQSPTPAAAQELLGIIVQGKQMLTVHNVPLWSEVETQLKPAVQGDRVVLSVDNKTRTIDKLITIFVAPAVQMQRSAANRTQVGAKLSELGLAMLTYEVQFGKLPRAIMSKDGKPLLSWRVALLPGVEQMQLFKQFHRNEPWDSEHNKKLIDPMPEIFKSPGRADSTKTAFLVPVGKGTPFEQWQPMTFKDIMNGDGATNTIMIVEAREDKAVIWTKPDDLEVDLDHPWVGLQDARDQGFMAVFCDRSTRWISNKSSPLSLKAAFTANGGEPEAAELTKD